MATTRKRTTKRKASTRRRSSRPLAGPSFDETNAAARTALYWLMGGTVSAIALYVLGKKAYKETVGEYRENRSQQMATQDGTAAFFANQLRIAFHPSGSETVSDWFGDGTDEEKVKQLISEIPSAKVYRETVHQYSILTGGRNLNADLGSELTSIWGNEDYDEVLSLLKAKK